MPVPKFRALIQVLTPIGNQEHDLLLDAEDLQTATAQAITWTAMRWQCRILRLMLTPDGRLWDPFAAVSFALRVHPVDIASLVHEKTAEIFPDEDARHLAQQLMDRPVHAAA